ncbi:MAG: pitrilysin family protein [Erysipelotrichaceae bacterium]|nr:insulinase family protein [Solobacterium sp.]MDY3793743.1 pitrilysin family protein [Erysipelotrichaceae bacterium]
MKKIHNDFFDEDFYIEKLDNGLEVVIFNKKDFLTTACAFATSYGALNTDEVLDGKEYHFHPGVAHFLEHKLFESEDKNIFEEFSNMGCNVNAFTSYHETVYYFTTTNKEIKEPLNLLLDFVQKLDITDENVEKEKGIICQELAMYMQNPDSRLLQETYRSLYHNYPLKYDIGGDETSVNAISKDELDLCYKVNYHPNNMVLLIVSPLDVNYLMDVVKENQSKKHFDKQKDVKTLMIDEDDSVVRKEFSFEMDINKPKHVYALKLKPNFKDSDDIVYKQWCLDLYLKAYFSSINKDYQEWLNKGLINDYFGYEVDFDKDYAYILFYNESEDDNIKELVDNELKKDLITEEILTSIKRRYIGNSFDTLNDVESFDTGYVRDYVNGIDYFKSIEILTHISLDDLKAVFKGFDYSNYALIHILPCGK